MSHPLPFGVARDRALDCQIGDWVSADAEPGWAGSQANQSIRPSGGKRLAKPWLFTPVVHATAAGEEIVWKRVM